MTGRSLRIAVIGAGARALGGYSAMTCFAADRSAAEGRRVNPRYGAGDRIAMD